MNVAEECVAESNLLLHNAEWNLNRWRISQPHFQTHKMQLNLNPSFAQKGQQLDPVVSATPITSFNLLRVLS
ncbi:hypothetical protein CR513_27656, partial [Mucuna pruriens]